MVSALSGFRYQKGNPLSGPAAVAGVKYVSGKGGKVVISRFPECLNPVM